MSNVVGSKAVEEDVRTNSPTIGIVVSLTNPFGLTKSGRGRGEKRKETWLAEEENWRGWDQRKESCFTLYPPEGVHSRKYRNCENEGC